MDRDDYPFFIPPAHLATRHSRQWSLAEAEEYKRWLLEVRDSRIGNLLALLEEERANRSPEEHLQAVGNKSAQFFWLNGFSEEGPRWRVLNDRGMALAADLGLLVARYLLENCKPHVEWKILRTRKNEFSYNLPVLVGFRNTYLEPIGGSISEADALLRGDRGPDI